jgi:hypothetical protein
MLTSKILLCIVFFSAFSDASAVASRQSYSSNCILATGSNNADVGCCSQQYDIEISGGLFYMQSSRGMSCANGGEVNTCGVAQGNIIQTASTASMTTNLGNMVASCTEFNWTTNDGCFMQYSVLSGGLCSNAPCAHDWKTNTIGILNVGMNVLSLGVFVASFVFNTATLELGPSKLAACELEALTTGTVEVARAASEQNAKLYGGCISQSDIAQMSNTLATAISVSGAPKLVAECLARRQLADYTANGTDCPIDVCNGTNWFCSGSPCWNSFNATGLPGSYVSSDGYKAMVSLLPRTLFLLYIALSM